MTSSRSTLPAATDLPAVADYLHACVRTVPDWPIAGVQFRDITPLFSSADTLGVIVDAFVAHYRPLGIDYFAGLEARGFILAPLLAHALGAGFIPLRKQGKLPYKTISESYKLEYGEATLEAHVDACPPGARVVIVDDLIATGGTMLAGLNLIRQLGAQAVEGAALIDLPDLGGTARVREAGLPLFTLCAFDGH